MVERPQEQLSFIQIGDYITGQIPNNGGPIEHDQGLVNGSTKDTYKLVRPNIYNPLHPYRGEVLKDKAQITNPPEDIQKEVERMQEQLGIREKPPSPIGPFIY